MLKIPWNTQKTSTKHALRLFKNFLKIRFSAQKSGSRPRCRTKLKILWNTQKTPTKHALRHFRKLLKIRFLAEKSGSRLRCRIMLKIPWNTQKTPTKRVLILNNGEMSWTNYTVYNFADDLHWPELGILLESIDYHETVRKASFLGSMCEDPFMAAIHFERRLDALMKYFINSQEHPIGKVKVFFYRVEFQIRGTITW